jgi:5'-nucleotidase
MERVLIADPIALQDKIAQFQHAKTRQLCVVSDWDRTLTKARTEDGQDATSYSVIAHGAYLGEAYRVEMDRLYARYRPIEISQKISHRKKQKAMHDWWMAALEMMQKYGLTEEIIEDIAAREFMRLRDSATDFFNILSNRDIPLLILSAGIDNVISKFLNVRSLLTSNVTVTANKLVFDAQGALAGFCEPIIHSFNKARPASAPRGCVLLIGDTIEDAQMVNDADADCLIRVGFLNEAIKENSATYLCAYDIVICNDASMAPVIELLRRSLDTL